MEEGRCIIDLSDVTVGGSVAWTASVLVHESNHNRQYRDDLANHGHPVAAESYTGVEAELACNQVQLRALERVGGTPREIVYLKSQDGKHFDVDGDGDYDWDDYRLRRW